MIDAAVREKMITRSLVSVGTRAYWARILHQKRISLAFMGGSVTQGYENYRILPESYPGIAADMLRQQGYEVECTICADAGMDSLTGAVLAEDVVLSKKPDIVFLEYAINETTLRHSVEYFESLVRRLLDAPCSPAVCLLLMRSANDYSCASFMRPMAEHYGLSCIDMREALNPSLAAQELTWDAFADKESHPNSDGHRLLAECVLHLIRCAGEQPRSPLPALLPEPWLDAPFQALRRIEEGQVPEDILVTPDYPVSPRPLQFFHRSWCITKASGAWTMHCRCRTAVIFFEAHIMPGYGSCRILLDGKPVKHLMLDGGVLHTHSIYAWGNPHELVLMKQAEPAEHTITLEPLEDTVYLLCAAIE